MASGVAFHLAQPLHALSIRHVFLMISQKVYEVTMGLCHLYSYLDKSYETLRLSLPSLDLRKARFKKKISNLSQDRHLPLDSGNFNQTSKQESTIAIGKTFHHKQ